MAPKKHQQSPRLDHWLHAALRGNADILAAAPEEYRAWLKEVIKGTCPEDYWEGPDSPYDIERQHAAQRRRCRDLLEMIRAHGLAGGYDYFYTDEGDFRPVDMCGTTAPSSHLTMDLARRALADPNANRRVRAVSLVLDVAEYRTGMACTDKEAVSLLTPCLRDEALPVRWAASLGLSRLAPQTPGVIEELASVVRSEPAVAPQFGLYWRAVRLAALNVPMDPRQLLRRRQPDPDPERPAGAPEAALALARLGKLATPALPALRERLARGLDRTGADFDAWRAAREALDAITGSTEESRGILVNWVRRALTLEIPGEVGRQLLLDLARVDPTGAEVGPLFMDALRNPDLAVTAAAALYGAGPAGLPALATALAHEMPSVRLTAARTLARMGSKAGAAVPALVGALNDPDKDVRQAVRDALASIHSYLFVTRHLGRSQEEAFLESILETLGDEAPCLIYADWLEEYGNAAGQACAQIVRERLMRRRGQG